MFISKLDKDKNIGIPQDLRVQIGEEMWSLDTIEEFLADYPKSSDSRFDHISQGKRFIIYSDPSCTNVCVELPNRALIESVFQIFEQNAETSKISIKPTVFIGHGRDSQWRDLKDHLQDKHGIGVTAYEVGPRAGLSVKEVLEDMLEISSFALLVLTGEDIDTYGELHARENVIHEIGLFQGRIGFERAIILLEEGVTEFSNILGVNQIRFSKGRIRETFGDVIAMIKREFGS